jgi:hypothetical protein
VFLRERNLRFGLRLPKTVTWPIPTRTFQADTAAVEENVFRERTIELLAAILRELQELRRAVEGRPS